MIHARAKHPCCGISFVPGVPCKKSKSVDPCACLLDKDVSNGGGAPLSRICPTPHARIK